MKTKTCPMCLWSNEAHREGIEFHCGTCHSQSTNGSQMTGWVQSPSYETEEDDNES